MKANYSKEKSFFGVPMEVAAQHLMDGTLDVTIEMTEEEMRRFQKKFPNWKIASVDGKAVE